MTVPADHRSRRRALYGWMRLAGAVTAAFAVAALVAVGPTTRAQAAATDSYNQMTGAGLTASAVTVNWTSGLLNAENQPITTAGTELSPNSDRQAQSPTSPLSFMYKDFQNLQVTVSQTDNISEQGITVHWKGFQKTKVATSEPAADFLQMMECWGNADTGPSPENCEYGSLGMLGKSTVPNSPIGDRGGPLCAAGSVPSTVNPPGGKQGGPDYGCDPNEPTSETIPHCDPNAPAGNACSDGQFEIPFVGVDAPTAPIYGQQNLLQDFSEYNTNEVQATITNPDGTGTLQFAALTGIQAPHLGCGLLEADGKPRGCWLVIVPRGSYEPNGFPVQLNAPAPDGFVDTSPLSAGNWAQRMQIHLNYAPLGTACPPTTLPDQVAGTQVITRAVESWELALNLAAKCNTVYAYTATTENESTTDIEAVGPTNGDMAFTTIPIGSETTRYTSGKPPSLPNMLYAPVAVTAMDFGFNINESGAFDATPVKLTPALVARALTQTYKTDLPDYGGSDSSDHPGPPWAKNNPINITEDPAFTALNPASLVPGYQQSAIPLAPLLTEDHSQLNQLVWQWVQSDPATAAWLDTAPKSTDSVEADPDYVKLSPQLGKSPALDSFPRAYTGKLDLGPCSPTDCPPVGKQRVLNSIDLLPYVADIGTAASLVLAANDTATTPTFDFQGTAPDGTKGWWTKVGVQPVGSIFMWGMSDMPDLAAYGLIGAALCNPTGTSCVGPTVDSVGKTLDAATAGSDGLLTVNPAKVPAGGYPLVQVVYAAIPTNQSKQSLSDYAALIKYAANQGQTPGTNPGDLPPGYLPLTAKLKVQANAVVAKLDAIVNPTPSKSPTPTPTPTHSASPTSSPTPTVTSTGTQSAPSSSTATATGTVTSTSPGSGGTTQPAISPSTGVLPTSPTACARPSGTASACPGGGAGASGSPSPQGPVIEPPTSAQLASSSTQATVVSNIRLVLIAVLIIGATGAIVGTALRADWRPRRRTRRRT